MGHNGMFAGGRGAIYLWWLCAAWSLAAVGILHLNENGAANKAIFTLLCGAPLLLSSWVFYAHYVRVVFNATKTDDYQVRVPAMMAVYAVWVLNWALIFMALWAWDRGAWTELAGQRAYLVFLRLITLTLLLAAGVGFTTHVASSLASQLVASVMAFTAIALSYTVVAAGVGVVMENVGVPRPDVEAPPQQQQQQQQPQNKPAPYRGPVHRGNGVPW